MAGFVLHRKFVCCADHPPPHRHTVAFNRILNTPRFIICSQILIPEVNYDTKLWNLSLFKDTTTQHSCCELLLHSLLFNLLKGPWHSIPFPSMPCHVIKHCHTVVRQKFRHEINQRTFHCVLILCNQQITHDHCSCVPFKEEGLASQ